MGEPGLSEDRREDPAETARQARALVDRLAAMPEPAAFQELLGLMDHLGGALGASARTLAEQGSWTQVGNYAGTTKQGAWSRWHG